MRSQSIHGLRVERRRIARLLQELASEAGYVVSALAERRQVQHALLQAMDDRAGQLPAPDGLHRVAVRRQHETRPRLGLQGRQDFLLDSGRNAIDPGHEESAGPRSFESLDESLAVDGSGVGLGAARGEPVEESRRDFLLRAVLPGDEHGAFRSEPFDRRHRFEPSARAAGQRDRGFDAGEPQSSFLRALALFAPPPDCVEEEGDPPGGHRPPEKIVGAVFHRRDRVFEAAGGRERPENAIRLISPGVGRQALGLLGRQVDGVHDDVRQEFGEMAAGLGRRADAPDLTAGGGHRAAQGIARFGIGIDDEDLHDLLTEPSILAARPRSGVSAAAGFRAPARAHRCGAGPRNS